MSKQKNNKNNKNMILVEAGRFEMGKNRDKHFVTIGNDFYISKYQVTFAEYDEFYEDEGKKKPDDKGWGRGNRPVINISWYDAIEFCNWKSKKDGYEEVYIINKKVEDKLNKSINDNKKWTLNCDFDKKGYRLPTEAEWEFAAKGGNKSKGYIYSGSNEIKEVARCYVKNGSKTHPVGNKESNELGIHDMSGNVEEFCWDWYDTYVNSSYSKGPNTGSFRVGRGGSWNSNSLNCRIASRYSIDPSFSYDDNGFRLTRTC